MNQADLRYARHYLLEGFGREAQEKLTKARVLVIGAGGLGCPVLQYLAAAGIGTIGIVDFDTIAISNLHRQVLYETKDVGKAKAVVAAKRLQMLNPLILIKSYDVAISTKNAFELFKDYDIIVDCTDNFSTRYLVNDACVLLNKPLVFGAVFRFEGQVAVFNVMDENGLITNYRHLFATPPALNDVPDCNEVGVLGTLTGIIGNMQATEVIKLLTGMDGSLKNKVLTFNLLNYDSYVVNLADNENAGAHLPKDRAAYEQTDYIRLCGETVPGVTLLNIPEFLNEIKNPAHLLIDVREPHELPKLEFKNSNMPLPQLKNNLEALTSDQIILICQSGKRSLEAAEILLNVFGTSKKISHLSGGINKLLENRNE